MSVACRFRQGSCRLRAASCHNSPDPNARARTKVVALTSYFATRSRATPAGTRPRPTHVGQMSSPGHDRGNRQVDGLSTTTEKGTGRCSPRTGPTRSLPEPTRSRNPYTAVGRQKRWRSGSLFGACVAHGPPIWRLKWTTRQPLQASTRGQRVIGNRRYQPLRDSLSGYADEHAVTSVSGHRDDAFRP